MIMVGWQTVKRNWLQLIRMKKWYSHPILPSSFASSSPTFPSILLNFQTGTYWGLCRLLTRCATYEEVQTLHNFSSLLTQLPFCSFLRNILLLNFWMYLFFLQLLSIFVLFCFVSYLILWYTGVGYCWDRWRWRNRYACERYLWRRL